MSATLHYELENDGIVQVTTTRNPIGKCEDFLKNQLAQSPVDLLSTFQSVRGKPVHINISAKNMVLYERLMVLPLETWWMLDGKVLVPWFTNADGTNRTRFDWVPPQNMALMMAAWFNVSAPRYVFSTAYLVAVGDDGKRYRLPFSNLYPDARVCLGDHANVNGENYAASMDFIHQTMVANPWGLDLLGTANIGSAGKFIRFSPAGKQLDPIDDWKKYSTVASCEGVNRMKGEAIWK